MIAGNEPVTIVLRFHPLLAGRTASVRTGNGVVLQPAARQLQIGPTGEAVLLATVEAGKTKAAIGVAINGIDTFLHLSRFSENFVGKREEESGKGPQ